MSLSAAAAAECRPSTRRTVINEFRIRFRTQIYYQVRVGFETFNLATLLVIRNWSYRRRVRVCDGRAECRGCSRLRLRVDSQSRPAETIPTLSFGISSRLAPTSQSVSLLRCRPTTSSAFNVVPTVDRCDVLFNR